MLEGVCFADESDGLGEEGEENKGDVGNAEKSDDVFRYSRPGAAIFFGYRRWILKQRFVLWDVPRASFRGLGIIRKVLARGKLQRFWHEPDYQKRRKKDSTSNHKRHPNIDSHENI